MASITLLPTAAVDRICHDEQMVIWEGDLVGALGLGDFLRSDLSYDEVLDLHATVRRELRNIIGMVLDHPEARTIYRAPTAKSRQPARTEEETK